MNVWCFEQIFTKRLAGTEAKHTGARIPTENAGSTPHLYWKKLYIWSALDIQKMTFLLSMNKML